MPQSHNADQSMAKEEAKIKTTTWHPEDIERKATSYLFVSVIIAKLDILVIAMCTLIIENSTSNVFQCLNVLRIG